MSLETDKTEDNTLLRIFQGFPEELLTHERNRVVAELTRLTERCELIDRVLGERA